MKIPHLLQLLLARKSDNREGAYSNDTQRPSSYAAPYGQGVGNYHHVTAYEVQRRATEQHYWGEQLRVAKKLNRLTRKMNCITMWGIVATFLSLLFLWWTLNVTIKNAQLDQRAWVGIGDMSILNKPTVGTPLEIKAVLKNSGRSPAIHMFTYGHFFLLKRAVGDVRIPFTEHPDLLSCEGPKPYWNDVLGGSMFIPGSDSMSLNRVSEALPEAFLEFVMRGKTMSPQDLSAIPTAPNTPPETRSWGVGLFFVGCIDYFDIFRNAHRTSFCYFFSHDGRLNTVQSNGNLSNCVRGNDAD
jgi:hypothetical protein